MENKITIKGRVHKAIDEHVFLKCYYNGFKTYKAEYDEEGRFILEIDADEPNFYYFQVDNQTVELFLSPGDCLNIDCSSDSFFSSLDFSGDNSRIQEFLRDEKERMKEINKTSVNVFSLPIKKFEHTLDSMLSLKNEFIDNYFEEEVAKYKQFVDIQKSQYTYSWAINKWNYPKYHETETGIRLNLSSINYFSFIDKLDLHNGAAIKSTKFIRFLDLFLTSKIDSICKKDPAIIEKPNYLLDVKCDLINKYFKNDDVKNKLLFDLMDYQLWSNPYGIDEYISVFNQSCNDEKLKKLLNTSYSAFQRLQTGNIAPNFSFTDSLGNVLSLDNFKGKYLYIDVWASWCNPCIKEMPFLNELKADFRDKNITFISVSVDDSHKNWLSSLKKYELTENQYIAVGGWNSKLIENYKILSIPRFILLSPKGKIIEPDAANPSGNIKLELMKLNI